MALRPEAFDLERIVLDVLLLLEPTARGPETETLLTICYMQAKGVKEWKLEKLEGPLKHRLAFPSSYSLRESSSCL